MILAPTCRHGAEAWASAVCPEPGGAAARTSGAGERSPPHTSVVGAQQHDPVARLPGARTESVRHSGAVRRHSFSRRPSSSVGPRATYAVAFGAARRPVDTLPPCRRATQGCAPAARVPETTPVGAQLARGNKAVGRRALKITLPPPHLRFTAIAPQWRGAL